MTDFMNLTHSSIEAFLSDAQLGLVCSRGSEFTTKLLVNVVDGNRDFFRTYSPLKVPGLEENFGLARLYNCSVSREATITS